MISTPRYQGTYGAWYQVQYLGTGIWSNHEARATKQQQNLLHSRHDHRASCGRASRLDFSRRPADQSITWLVYSRFGTTGTRYQVLCERQKATSVHHKWILRTSY